MTELLRAKYATLMADKLQQSEELAASEEDKISIAKVSWHSCFSLSDVRCNSAIIVFGLVLSVNRHIYSNVLVFSSWLVNEFVE